MDFSFALTDNVKKIIDVLRPYGQTRVVGGAVRELLMNHKPYDIDLATQVLPNKVMELLESTGIQVIPTGIKFGTVMAIIDEHKYEITTLRSDIKSTGRHAEVEYTLDFEIDSNRRDFTMNAMYLDLDGKLYDYHNGLSDIKAKTIRFIGDANARIKEDHLRILRFFRFYGYYEHAKYDESAIKACCENIHLISELSGERIRDELFRIFILKNANQTLELMERAKVLQNVFDADMERVKFNHAIQNPIAALAYIFIHSNLDFKKAKRLRLSNAQMHMLARLIELYRKFDFNTDQLKYTYIHGRAQLIAQLELHFLLTNEKVELVPEPSILPVFPIHASDLIHLGYSGKRLGEAIKVLEQKWIDSSFLATKDELLKLL